MFRTTFRKSALFAVAAAFAVATASLATSSTAEAFGNHKGGFHKGGGFQKGGFHKGGGFQNKMLVKKPGWAGPHWHGKHCWKWGHCKPHRHGHWRRPIYVAPPVVYSAAPRVAPARTCLTKEYTPQGQVLFRDVCTGEMAINPPTAPNPQQLGMQPTDQQPQVAYVPQYPPQPQQPQTQTR